MRWKPGDLQNVKESILSFYCFLAFNVSFFTLPFFFFLWCFYYAVLMVVLVLVLVFFFLFTVGVFSVSVFHFVKNTNTKNTKKTKNT